MRESLGQAAIYSGRIDAWSAIEGLGVLVRRHRPDNSIGTAIRWIIRVNLIGSATTACAQWARLVSEEARLA